MAELTLELRLPATRLGSTKMVSAITNQRFVRLTFFDGAINTDRFIDFLGDLIKDGGRKVLLIADNLRVHLAKRVTEWVDEHRAKIEIFCLPPYAPALNPDENLNRDLKTSIRSGPIGRAATAFRDKVRLCMERIAAMPERVRSYFSHEHVQYAQ